MQRDQKVDWLGSLGVIGGCLLMAATHELMISTLIIIVSSYHMGEFYAKHQEHVQKKA